MHKNQSKFSLISGLILVSLLIFMIVQTKSRVLVRDHYDGMVAITLICLILIVVFSFFSLDPKNKKAKRVLECVFFFVAPLAGVFCIELLNKNFLWEIEQPVNALMNYLICLLFMMIAYGITGSISTSVKIMNPVFCGFGIANMYVKLYKGSPLIPWDLFALHTANKVAGSFSYQWYWEMICSLAITVLIWKVTTHLNEKNKKTLFIRVTRILCIALFVFCTALYYGTDIMAEEFGATPDFFNQTRGYENMGAIAEFIVNTKYMRLNPPADYDADKVEAETESVIQASQPTITETITGQKPLQNVKQPNIIVIMNESFSDLSVIGDFKTNEDPIPYINSLKNDPNTIEGNSYVSTIGTGTSNTEYEFLTGNSMAFLPIGSNAYQLYVQNGQPSLVSTLKSQAYSADVFHPYYKDDWNRPYVYKAMGFDSFTAMEDLSDYQVLRNYISDAYDFSWVKNAYENRDKNKPFFLFNITMQNHASYDKQYSNFDQQIHLEGMKNDYPAAEQYLSLCKATDDAFKDLITYFDAQSEPTIILMFGDHQPFIENGFYEEVMGKPISKLNDDENQKRYITRFIMHANYDIPSGWADDISVNYLSVLLEENANLHMSEYDRFRQAAYQQCPVITALGCRDKEGHYFKVNDAGQYDELIGIYERDAYNNLRDHDHLAENIFYIDKHEDDNS